MTHLALLQPSELFKLTVLPPFEVIPYNQLNDKLIGLDKDEEKRKSVQDSLLCEFINVCRPQSTSSANPESLCDFFDVMSKVVLVKEKMSRAKDAKGMFFFPVRYSRQYGPYLESKLKTCERDFNKKYDELASVVERLRKFAASAGKGAPIPAKQMHQLEKEIGNLKELVKINEIPIAKIIQECNDISTIRRICEFKDLPNELHNPLRRVIKISKQLEQLKLDHPLSESISLPPKVKTSKASAPVSGYRIVGIYGQERMRKLALRKLNNAMSEFSEKMKEISPEDRITCFNKFGTESDRDEIKRKVWEKMGSPQTWGSDFGGEQIQYQIDDPRVYETVKKGIFFIQVKELLNQLKNVDCGTLENEHLNMLRHNEISQCKVLYNGFSKELQENLKWGFWFMEGMPLGNDDFGKTFVNQNFLSPTVREVMTNYIKYDGKIIDPSIVEEFRNVIRQFYQNDKRFQQEVSRLSDQAKALLKKGIAKESKTSPDQIDLYLTSRFQLILLNL